MKKRVIFWVHGGISGKKVVGFEYRGEELTQIILPKAIEEYLSKRGEQVDLITFVPHSIYTKDAQKELEEMEKEMKNVERISLPSIGKFAVVKNIAYIFNGSYGYVRFWVFINLLKRYLKNEYSIFYFDISQGLNIYMDAFKEAFRSLVVFDKLREFPEGKIKVYILYSDPILGGVENARIYDDIELKVKAFFDSPINRPDREFANRHSLDADIKRVLTNFYRTFRAIKYNAPGLVLTFGYDKADRIAGITEKLLEKYINQHNPGEFWEAKRVYEYNLPEKPEEKTSIFLALALYENMTKVLEGEGIPPESKREFTTQELLKFLNVYKRYELRVNADMLEKDIKRYEEVRAPEHWTLAGYVVNRNNFKPKQLEDLRRDPNAKRNFFAHSGLENNMVMVRRADDGQIVFKYTEESHSLIESFLYD
ncbi:MAG: hypothetical protein NZ526_02290 [Aquificaceae bacterium]|nr:hypothetical protein [Aquificaceae bacterium]